MSSGQAEVTIIITITIIPVFSIGLPTVVLMALVGILATAIIAAAIAVVAIIGWSRCLVLAVRESDRGWIRDLTLVPAVAAWAAVVFSVEFARWSTQFPHSDVIGHLKSILPQSGPIVLVPLVLGPLAAILWFASLAATPGLLARRDNVRLLAYPAFAVFSVWITAIVLTWQS